MQCCFCAAKLTELFHITALAHPQVALHCPFGKPCSINSNIQCELPGELKSEGGCRPLKQLCVDTQRNDGLLRHFLVIFPSFEFFTLKLTRSDPVFRSKRPHAAQSA